MEYKKITRTNFADDICEQIKEFIRNREWAPDSKIPSESELVDRFGVSRVSIRSAMDKLRGQGLIITFQGKGSYVAKDAIKILSDSFDGKIFLEKKDYIDIVSFRSALELSSVELMETRAGEEDYARIKAALDKMQESVDDREEYTKYNYQYEDAIVRASKNKIFIGILEQNEELFTNFLRFQNARNETKFQYSLDNHRAIYDALVNKQTTVAQGLMKKAFDRNIKRLFKD